MFTPPGLGRHRLVESAFYLSIPRNRRTVRYLSIIQKQDVDLAKNLVLASSSPTQHTFNRTDWCSSSDGWRKWSVDTVRHGRLTARVDDWIDDLNWTWPTVEKLRNKIVVGSNTREGQDKRKLKWEEIFIWKITTTRKKKGAAAASSAAARNLIHYCTQSSGWNSSRSGGGGGGTTVRSDDRRTGRDRMRQPTLLNEGKKRREKR